MESNYEKADKLLEIRDNAQGRLAAVESEIDKEKQVRSCGEGIAAILTLLCV